MYKPPMVCYKDMHGFNCCFLGLWGGANFTKGPFSGRTSLRSTKEQRETVIFSYLGGSSLTNEYITLLSDPFENGIGSCQRVGSIDVADKIRKAFSSHHAKNTEEKYTSVI